MTILNPDSQVLGDLSPVESAPAKPLRRAPLFLLPAIWFGLSCACFWAIETYKATPGGRGRVPERLPFEFSNASTPRRPQLMMFVHPKCPCSVASLSVLEELLARHPGVADTEIVFVLPPGVEAGWEQGALWRRAATIHGSHVIRDPEGSRARRMGAETSGHVLLYDAEGTLRFDGGITRSRGHEGESAGQQALSALLSGQKVGRARFPVFGCPLLGNGACPLPKTTDHKKDIQSE